MITKMDNKDLRLFEATGEGVAAYALEQAIGVYLQSDTIGFRRLTKERTDDMRKILSSFVRGE